MKYMQEILPDASEQSQSNFAFVPKKNSPLLVVYGLGIVLLILLFAKSYSFFMSGKDVESPETDVAVVASPELATDSESTSLATITDSDSPAGAGTTNSALVPVTSKYRAYTHVGKDGILQVVPIDVADAPYAATKYGTVYGGGSLGQGSSGPELAPDMQKFAFAREGVLKLVSVDGATERVIPLANVEYVTGWSPDSSKMIAYVSSKSIENLFAQGGPGSPVKLEVTVDLTQPTGGFYLIDFNKNTLRHMSELDGMLVHSWVDADSLIISDGAGQYENFMYYNLATQKVSTETVKKLNDVFGHQMSFSANGSKWSTVTSVIKNNLDKAQITMGNFPNFGDIARIEVPWARKQGPVMSPSGDKVAIWGSPGDGTVGDVYIYRGTTLDYVAKGRPSRWIDNDRLVFVNEDAVYTYNFATSETKQLK